MGSRVILHSDSKSLEYMKRYANQFGKIGRWLNYFSLYDTTFHWTRGLSMGLPDYLSRAPVVDNDMSEDGEQENHKLNPEYLQNLVYKPSITGEQKTNSTTPTVFNSGASSTKSADAKLQSGNASRKIIL